MKTNFLLAGLLGTIGLTLSRIAPEWVSPVESVSPEPAAMRRGYRPSHKACSKYMPHIGAKERAKYSKRTRL